MQSPAITRASALPGSAVLAASLRNHQRSFFPVCGSAPGLRIGDCLSSSRSRSSRPHIAGAAAAEGAAKLPSTSNWQGRDAFTPLGDRVDAPPLPLPSISEPVRVVVVRHGQSTWNSEGRIQVECNPQWPSHQLYYPIHWHRLWNQGGIECMRFC